ncbi:MAG: TIGR00725 family protein [Candidatus Aenigmarchaeota archaeon]|nr:TIGR00725 family protein [Candidatus Aenigmarchaeota archaeon]
MKRTIVGVVGQSVGATEEQIKAAERVGRLLAKRNVVVVCGGRNIGIMDAVAKGVEEEGGICVGILPEEDLSQASRHLTIPIPTGMGYARNRIVALASDALIVVGGGVGTLTEVSYAYLQGKPIVVIKGLGSICEQYIGKYLDSKKITKLMGADSPEEAVEIVMKILEGNSGDMFFLQ